MRRIGIARRLAPDAAHRTGCTEAAYPHRASRTRVNCNGLRRRIQIVRSYSRMAVNPPAFACWLVVAAACCGLFTPHGALGLPQVDRLPGEVVQLPGLLQNMPSKQFAGYVTVDASAGRHLYYYLATVEDATLVQQQHDHPLGTAAGAGTGAGAAVATAPRKHRPYLAAAAVEAPLVLWLTGGPGCSSMDAFAYEHGPFRFASRAGRGPRNLDDVILMPNPYSWSKVVNMLYVDSPEGTGMSYTDGQDQYATNDTATVEDLYRFVLGWLQQYPEFVGQPLYLAGESYAGIYIPLLAQRILRGQRMHQQHAEAKAAAGAAATVSPDDINLQGYIIGNGVTDDRFDSNSQLDFAWGMGYVDPLTYSSVKATCKGIYWNATSDSPCGRALEALDKVLGDLNPYDTLDKCVFHRDAEAAPTQERPLRQHAAANAQQPHSTVQQQQQQSVDQLWPRKQQGTVRRVTRRGWPFTAVFDRKRPLSNWWQMQKQGAGDLQAAPHQHHEQQVMQQLQSNRRQVSGASVVLRSRALSMAARSMGKHVQQPAGIRPTQQRATSSSRRRRGALPHHLGHTIACADRSHALVFFNSPAVRRALHAAPLSVTGSWEPCSDVLNYTSDIPSVLEVHRDLLSAGLRGLVLSGDHDYVVPFTGTREWVWGLGLTVEEGWAWGPWHTPDQQVAGYAVRFEEGLTYATVKGAGHMVPQTQPAASQHMLGLWLQHQL